MRDRIGMSFGVRRSARRGTGGSRGQSLTELALVLPILLVVVLIGLDFGRAFQGWVGLQQSARIAANFVGTNPTAWDGSHPHGWHSTQQQLETLLYNDASTSNCERQGANWLTIVVISPTNTNYSPGDPAAARIECEFSLLTPIISAMLPSPLTLSASAAFPIRTAVVRNIIGALNVSFYWVRVTGTPVCPDPCYKFYDISSPTPSAWSWNFGDSGTATLQSPTHSYASGCAHTSGDPCTYTVTLTVTTSAGSGSASEQLTVPSNAFPVANFTASPTSGNPPLAVQFVNLSTGNPTSYSWTFGVGEGTSTSASPSHTYTSAGTFTARLTVNGGSYKEMNISVGAVTPPPVANFTFAPTSGTAPLFVQFTDTSSGSPTSWAWDLDGNGSTDTTAQNPSYTYNSAGTYAITLTATNAAGSSAPTTQYITVSTALCQVPTFVDDSYKHNGQAAFQSNEQSKWTTAGFSSSLIFQPLLTSSGGKVTSQSYTAGSFQECAAATITLTGTW